MRDTIITAKVKRRELWIFLACFLVAFLFNIYAIIAHKTSAIELVTQLPVVLLVTLVIYALAAILRVLIELVSRLWRKKV